jgi:hypothetical protein
MVPPLLLTPSEVLQTELNKLVKFILGEDYLKLSINHLSLNENLLEEVSYISCWLNINKVKHDIEGTGKGIVDALFSGLIQELESKYVSLENLRLMDFSVEGDFEKKYKSLSNTDVDVEVRVLIQSSGSDFIFRERSASMNTAAIKVVLKVFEHFINSERAVEVTYECIQDAQKRSRPDLLEQYTRNLSELVRNINYEKKIDLLEGKMRCKDKTKF